MPSLKMVLLKRCCVCFSPRSGTVILGCFGILFSVLSMVPHVLILQHHEYYIGEFVKQQRSTGVRDIGDDDIPNIEYFSRMTWSFLVAVDVIFTFDSILLITGVACERRYFLIPWLVTSFCSRLFSVVMILAAMFSYANDFSFVIFFTLAPIQALGIYFWVVVYSTFHQMKPENESASTCALNFSQNHSTSISCQSRPNSLHSNTQSRPSFHGQSSLVQSTVATEPPSTTTVTIEEDRSCSQVTHSASISSVPSPRNTLRRTRGSSPPPPYEAVAVDIDKEQQAIAAGLDSKNLTFSKQNSVETATLSAQGSVRDSQNDVPTAVLISPVTTSSISNDLVSSDTNPDMIENHGEETDDQDQDEDCRLVQA